eukprot:g3761.t1
MVKKLVIDDDLKLEGAATLVLDIGAQCSMLVDPETVVITAPHGFTTVLLELHARFSPMVAGRANFREHAAASIEEAHLSGRLEKEEVTVEELESLERRGDALLSWERCGVHDLYSWLGELGGADSAPDILRDAASQRASELLKQFRQLTLECSRPLHKALSSGETVPVIPVLNHYGLNLDQDLFVEASEEGEEDKFMFGDGGLFCNDATGNPQFVQSEQGSSLPLLVPYASTTLKQLKDIKAKLEEVFATLDDDFWFTLAYFKDHKSAIQLFFLEGEIEKLDAHGEDGHEHKGADDDRHGSITLPKLKIVIHSVNEHLIGHQKYTMETEFNEQAMRDAIKALKYVANFMNKVEEWFVKLGAGGTVNTMKTSCGTKSSASRMLKHSKEYCPNRLPAEHQELILLHQMNAKHATGDGAAYACVCIRRDRAAYMQSVANISYHEIERRAPSWDQILRMIKHIGEDGVRVEAVYGPIATAHVVSGDERYFVDIAAAPETLLSTSAGDGEKAQLVCKYLCAFDKGNFGSTESARQNQGVDRLIGVLGDAVMIDKISADEIVDAEKAAELLNKYVDQNVITSKRLMKSWVSYLWRRCVALENNPHVVYNQGRQVTCDPERPDQPLRILDSRGRQLKWSDGTDKVEDYDTKKLVSSIMTAFIDEANKAFDPNSNRDWSKKKHVQVIIGESNQFHAQDVTFGVLSVSPDDLRIAERESWERMGMKDAVPDIDTLLNRKLRQLADLQDGHEHKIGDDNPDISGPILDRHLSNALGIPLHRRTKRLAQIDQEKYVLTPDYAIKMIWINERKVARHRLASLVI